VKSTSIFSNPAARSVEQATAYTSAVLDLLSTRDPLQVLRATRSMLHERIDGLTAQQVKQPEAPGKWSMRHVLQHLADSELVWAYRLRMVLAHDRPPITGYDQDLWAARLGYDEVEAEEAIHEFGVLRHANLRLLSRATDADMKRVGVHAERGEESVEHMIKLYAGHDLLHLQQLARIREAVTQTA
jgi:uncharacterized damage-inducible protein DinB